MKVFLNICDPDEDEKENRKKLHFGRVPVVGEFIAISDSVDWYKVVAVLHTPYFTQFDAEVFCVKIKRTPALKAAGYC
ncbi:hypothetical protein QUB08_29210 [Microcoleus sp. BR0-C5]|uniref:hypothetical protein n=1 Tax=Microcoleus sp. BR0-C5 TaxID=2818713 RepID=UPI002FD6249E